MRGAAAARRPGGDAVGAAAAAAPRGAGHKTLLRPDAKDDREGEPIHAVSSPPPRGNLASGNGKATSALAQGRVEALGGGPLIIFLILVVNAAVGIWQETNAEKALEALREIQSDHAAVLRGGEWLPALPARDLVPGDIVQLRVGDKVPADMRVARLVTSTLRVEQGSLTGETASVNKTSHPVPVEDADIQAKECMVFAGTTVVNGSAVCIVVHTGMATEIGKIHAQIHEASQEDDDTPLKKKLNEFGEALTKIIGLMPSSGSSM